MKMEELEKGLLSSRAWGMVERSMVAPWIIAFAGPPDRADVLEVGCGAGYDTETFVERFPGWHVVATDYDPDLVQLAGKRLARFADQVTVTQADATALDFPEKTFDVVISLGVWHHVGAWEKATAEAARVLRPAGTLVLADLLDGFFRGPLRLLFPPVRTYRLEELPRALSAAGFRLWRVRAAAALWYRAAARKG